jgi:hypothetical protein
LADVAKGCQLGFRLRRDVVTVVTVVAVVVVVVVTVVVVTVVAHHVIVQTLDGCRWRVIARRWPPCRPDHPTRLDGACGRSRDRCQLISVW